MNIPELLTEQGVHIQKLSYSCGPCSILNVLHIKGDFSQTEEGLTELCQALPGKGSKRDKVVSACQSVGLEVLESREGGVVEDIEGHLDAGAYVIVNYYHAFNGDGHYSVITDYDDRAVYIMDCSLGLIRLLKEDFAKYWYNSDKTVFGWYVAVK